MTMAHVPRPGRCIMIVYGCHCNYQELSYPICMHRIYVYQSQKKESHYVSHSIIECSKYSVFLNFLQLSDISYVTNISGMLPSILNVDRCTRWIRSRDHVVEDNSDKRNLSRINRGDIII